MNRHFARLSLMLVAFCLASSGTCAQAPVGAQAPAGPPVTTFVIDGSGSMWGPLGPDSASAKTEALKPALRAALAKVPAGARLGLVAFGHRQRGSCGDIEVLSLPEAGAPDRVPALADTISPKGKGPLANALREAAKAIDPATGASIVAIHDGPDNCQQDPCAAAAEIAKSKPKIVIHTLTLAAEPAEVARVACVSRATHGKAYDVRDGAALAAALGEVVKLANLEPEAAPAPREAARPMAVAPSTPPGVALSLSLADGSEPVTAPATWRVYAKDKPDTPVLTRTSATLAEPLAPGSYLVEVELDLAKQRREITVADGPPQSGFVALDAGLLGIAIKSASAPPHRAAVVTLLPKGSETALAVGRYDGREFVVPAGAYRAIADDAGTRAEADVEVAAGKATTATLSLNTGRIELSASATPGGPPVSGATFTVAVDDPEAPHGRREVARSAHSKPSFAVPPGTYYVSAELGSAVVRDRVAVSAGGVFTHPLVLNSARLTVTATLNGAPVPADTPTTYRVDRVGPDAQEIGRKTAASAEFTLPVGRYRVAAQIGGRNVRASGEVEVAAGRDLTANLNLQSAEIVTDRRSSAGAWEVRDGAGKVVLRSGHAAQPVRVAPGRYVLRALAASGAPETAFELKAGESRNLETLVP